MLALCSRGFGFDKLQNDPTYGWIARWFDHVPWEGVVFWDLIQPAFMFMVGAAMPFAMAKREAMGATAPDNFRHAASRAIKLVLLSQVLMCVSAGRLHFQLINVLSQMAFTYFLAYLILRMPVRAQVASAAGLMVLHHAIMVAFAGPEGAYAKVDNAGWRFDYWWLGRNYSGYYVTINFISSTVTTVAGAWAAMLIRSGLSHARTLRWLSIGAAGAFVSGFALSLVIPNVKRLWTPSFTLISLGWVLVMLIAFYWLIDARGWKRWAWPLQVMGMNSIFIYSVSIVLYAWLNRAVGVFTGNYTWVGTLAPVAQACTVVLAMWWLCWWLYKRSIFIKL